MSMHELRRDMYSVPVPFLLAFRSRLLNFRHYVVNCACAVGDAGYISHSSTIFKIENNQHVVASLGAEDWQCQ